MFDDKLHVSLFVYAILGAFFLIYALPFIYTGFSPYHEDPLANNPTVLSNTMQSLQEYPNPTRFALWFAEQRTMRLVATLFLIVSLVVVHLIKVNIGWKKYYCHFVLWLNMAVFLINYVGLVFFLVRN